MMKRRSVCLNLCLACVIAVGFGLTWGVVVGPTTEIVLGLLRPEAVHESLVVSRDGTPLIGSYRAVDYYDQTFRTLDGKVVEAERGNFTQGAWLNAPAPRHTRQRAAWMSRIRGASDGRTPPTYWYFVHDGYDNGRGSLMGFDKKTKYQIGYIGRSGFQQAPLPESEQFAVRSSYGPDFADSFGVIGRQPWDFVSYDNEDAFTQWIKHLISGDYLYEMDLRARTVRTMLTTQDLVSIRKGMRWVKYEIGGHDKPRWGVENFLAVRQSDRVAVLSPDGKPLRSYLLPAELRDSERLEFYELELGRALVAAVSGDRYSGIEEIALRWINASGDILERKEVTLVTGVPSSPIVESTAITPVVPVPAIITAGAVLIQPILYVVQGRERSYSPALARSLSAFSLGLPAVFVISALLAWACYRRQTRYAASGRWAWVAFVFVFGVPAYAGYLFHRRWPPLLPCPECDVPVPRDRDACSTCGRTFPTPEFKGIEVFA